MVDLAVMSLILNILDSKGLLVMGLGLGAECVDTQWWFCHVSNSQHLGQ